MLLKGIFSVGSVLINSFSAIIILSVGVSSVNAKEHEVCFNKEGNFVSLNCAFTIKELIELAEKNQFPESQLVRKHENGQPAIQVNNFQALFGLEEITGKKPSNLNHAELLRLRKLYDQ